MKKFIISLFLITFFNSVVSQCPNDLCETAIELELCVTESLSESCSVDWDDGSINLYGTGDTGGCNYQDFQFNEDQWFTFVIDDISQIIIDINTNYQAPIGSEPCPLNINGTNQGLVFILWTGNSCDSMIPIINTWNPSYCNGIFIVPPCPWSTNICNTLGCPTPSNNNIPDWIDINSPAYLATAYWNYFCCVNWNDACENRYALYDFQYNLSFDNWFWETGYPPEPIAVEQNPQDYLVQLTLPPGRYWIQLDPISCNPNTGGYSSEGTGTINVCPLFFLNFGDEEIEEVVEFNDPIIQEDRFKKVIHPRFGLLIYDTYKDKYYDIRMKHVNALR